MNDENFIDPAAALWLAALIWYTVRCVAADRKPRMEIVVPLMLLPWVLATWGEV